MVSKNIYVKIQSFCVKDLKSIIIEDSFYQRFYTTNFFFNSFNLKKVLPNQNDNSFYGLFLFPKQLIIYYFWDRLYFHIIIISNPKRGYISQGGVDKIDSTLEEH